jgi:hypothetical protein
MVVEIACEQHHPLILMKGQRAMAASAAAAAAFEDDC